MTFNAMLVGYIMRIAMAFPAENFPPVGNKLADWWWSWWRMEADLFCEG
jgi:hypothetical protein